MTVAYREHAVQVGVATCLDFGKLLKCSEDMPAPLLVHGIPSDLVQDEKRLDCLRSQQVV